MRRGVTTAVLMGLAAVTAPMRAEAQAAVFETLAQTLASPDDRVRSEVAAWLAESRPEAVGPLLARLARDPSPDVRLPAMLGLARISPSRATSTMVLGSLASKDRPGFIAGLSRRGLIDRAQLVALAEDRAGMRSPEERLAAMLALEDLGARAPVHEWARLARLLEGPARVEAMARAARGADGAYDFTETLRSDDHAIEEALHRAEGGAAMVGLASAVLDTAPGGSRAALGAVGLRLRLDARTPGLRRAWEHACLVGGEERSARIADVMLRAAAAAKTGGRPTPEWLADVPFVRGSTVRRAAADLLLSVGDPRAASETLLNTGDDRLAAALLDFAGGAAPVQRAAITEAALACGALGGELRSRAAGIAVSGGAIADGAGSWAGRGVEAWLLKTRGTTASETEARAAQILASGAAHDAFGRSRIRGELLDLAAELEWASGVGSLPPGARAEAAWLCLVLRDEHPAALARLPTPGAPVMYSAEPATSDTLLRHGD
jgi:hypothetical protein